ncbi:hypothetical protein [Rhodococcoides corynebacterioides]|uniref:hypothetical protein n=1 Tax=Rhodococcoides corynebacterioides TaxID=53972 RepID=UPI001C9B1F36|nr:hypothetical protein [Rhodococcus corynebacterioides]MBY6361706.1 hypothetical protein [Rhodococcus corynebacterioides]
MTVLHVLAAPDGTTGFYDLLAISAPPDLIVHSFSWKRALLGRYDVLHIHWPEYLLRGNTRPRTALKRALTAALLVRLARRRIAVVRTVHNLAPHEGTTFLERLLVGRLEKNVDGVIALNSATPVDPGVRSAVIPHPHYRAVEAFRPVGGHPRSPSILYFGLLRRYKGLDDLMTAYAESGLDHVPLRIIGRAQDDDVRARLQTFADRHPRVTVTFDYVSDRVLGAAVAEASHVVLPYTALHNSGALLLSSSVGTRVIAPRTPTTVLMQNEVGPYWLTLFDGDRITGEDLRRVVDSSNDAPPESCPPLSGREPARIGQAHLDFYRSIGRPPGADTSS